MATSRKDLQDSEQQIATRLSHSHAEIAEVVARLATIEEAYFKHSRADIETLFTRLARAEDEFRANSNEIDLHLQRSHAESEQSIQVYRRQTLAAEAKQQTLFHAFQETSREESRALTERFKAELRATHDEVRTSTHVGSLAEQAMSFARDAFVRCEHVECLAESRTCHTNEQLERLSQLERTSRDLAKGEEMSGNRVAELASKVEHLFEGARPAYLLAKM